MTTSRIRPSQRERKRYILVSVDSDEELSSSFHHDLIEEIENRFGLLDTAKATILPAKVYPSTNHVVLRVAHNYAEDLLQAARDTDELNGVPVDVTTEIMSGIIKQVKDYYKTFSR